MSNFAIESLASAIGTAFVVILCGYILRVTDVVSLDAQKALGEFVFKFALPALMILEVATLNFSAVDLVILGTLALSKFIVFMLAAFAGLLSTKGQGNRLSKAGIWGIFSTQSNDLVIGVTIFKALYPVEQYPEDFTQYMYLMVIPQLCLLNPIGFTLLEMGKALNGKAKESKMQTLLRVLRGVVTNPVVFTVALGVVLNFCFRSHLPGFIKDCFTLMGSGFGAAALFMLGMSVVGRAKTLLGPGSNLTQVFFLVAMKGLFLPVVSLYIGLALGNPHGNLGNFAFLYGAIPTTPAVYVFSTLYGVDVDIVAASLFLGLFLSAPVMFVTSLLLNQQGISSNVRIFSDYIHGGSVVGALWVLIGIVLVFCYKTHAKSRERLWMLAVAALGNLLWSISSILCNHEVGNLQDHSTVGPMYFVQVFFRNAAAFSVIALLLDTMGCARLFRSQFKWFALEASIILIPSVVSTLPFLFNAFPEDPAPPYMCWLNFGHPQFALALAWCGVAVIVIIIAIFKEIRADFFQQDPNINTDGDTKEPLLMSDTVSINSLAQNADNEAAIPNNSNSEDSNNQDSIVSVGNSTSPYTKDTTNKIKVIVLAVCQLGDWIIRIGLIINAWFTGAPTGSSLTVLIFAIVLDDGRGIILFFLFGLSQEILDAYRVLVDRIFTTFRNTFNKQEAEGDGEAEEIASEPMDVLALQQLVSDIERSGLIRNRRYRMKVHLQCLVGQDLVTWMVNTKRAQHRAQAVKIGRQLVSSNLLHHVRYEHQFCDAFMFYKLYTEEDLRISLGSARKF